MPNNPIRVGAAARRNATNLSLNKVARSIHVGLLITASATPAQKNGSDVTGGPAQRGALNPPAGGGGGGGGHQLN